MKITVYNLDLKTLDSQLIILQHSKGIDLGFRRPLNFCMHRHIIESVTSGVLESSSINGRLELVMCSTQTLSDIPLVHYVALQWLGHNALAAVD